MVALEDHEVAEALAAYTITVANVNSTDKVDLIRREFLYMCIIVQFG